MIRCSNCLRMTELQKRSCSHCGKVLEYTVSQKFDLLAESVENALKKELEKRRSSGGR